MFILALVMSLNSYITTMHKRGPYLGSTISNRSRYLDPILDARNSIGFKSGIFSE